MTPHEAFCKAGQVMFGDGWRSGRAFATALGPHHPEGPRESIDERLIRRWASGEREIEDWVIDALPRVLRAVANDLYVEAAAKVSLADTMLRIASLLDQDHNHATGAAQCAAGAACNIAEPVWDAERARRAR